MRLALACLAALLVPALSLAQTVTIVRADFNADTVGEAPDTSLPGGPEGDYMSISDSSPGQYTVVAESGDLTDQPLEGDRGSGSGSFKLYFWPPQESYACRQYIVEWCSVANTAFPPTFFVLRGDYPETTREGVVIFATMTYRGPTLYLDIAGQGETAVGSWTMGVANCFEWHLDLDALKQTLYIDDALVADSVDMWGHPQGAEFSYFGIEPSSTINFNYAIDDFQISVVDCVIPTETTSWSEIKSTYR